MSEILMGIFAVASSGVAIPAIVRLHRRKSSSDYSLWSMGLGLTSQTIWLMYAIYHCLPAMIAGGISWLTLLSVQTALILRWR